MLIIKLGKHDVMLIYIQTRSCQFSCGLVLYLCDLRQAIVRLEISRDLYKAFKHRHLLLNCLYITRRVSGHVYTCFL